MTRLPLRRIARATAAVSILAIVCTVAPGSPASGQPTADSTAIDFVRGSGRADARIIRIGPTRAQLSLAPSIGVALADYLNTVGRGESQPIDWVALGVALPPEVVNSVPSLRVESTMADSDKGQTKSVAGSPPLVAGELFARATKDPYGESSFALTADSIPGVIEIRNAVARSHSGVSGGKTREAVGTVDIGEIRLGDTVALKGLHWEAVQKTGGEQVTKGSFSIDALAVAGIAVPVDSLGSLVTTANMALAALGIKIVMPGQDVSGGVARIGPLGITLSGSETARMVFGPLYDALQPVRDPVTKAIIDASGGQASVLILVADIMLGVMTGASEMHLELGGATAYTEGQQFANPFAFALGNAPAPPLPAPALITLPGTPAIPAIAEIPAQAATTTTTRGATGSAALASRRIPGHSGGVAVIVGLLGLAAALGMAAADWLRMRHAGEAAVG